MRAIQFLTPHHDNMGDNAQAYCIYNMLSTFFGVDNILKFQLPDTDEGIKQVSKGDIIFLGSGGYLGDLWLRGEILRRKIIQKCSDNIIVSFPQTIFFSSLEEENKSIIAYKAHSHLHIAARDPESYVLAKTLFPTNYIFQLPDPVFTISHNKNYEREGILCIFRNDKEDWLKNQKQDIINLCKKYDSKVDMIDTEGKDDINRSSIKDIDKKLPEFLDNISKYKLVITDRFHGTVFAAITGTPCVAFPTINHKIVSSTYWHKYLKTNISICNNVQSLSDYLQNTPQPFIYNPSKAISLYHQTISSVIATGTISNLNTTEEIIHYRRTIRKWRPTPIPNNILNDIIQAGIDAPSGANSQCVRFKIAANKDTLNIISKKNKYTSNFPPAIIFVGYDFGVPNTVNFQHKNSVWEVLKYQDVAAVIENMLLYCESIGLSCCWLSYFQREMQRFLQTTPIKSPNIEYLSAIAVGMAEPTMYEFIHNNHSIMRKPQEYYMR